jgi:DNA polymerase III delta prime subunit
MISEIWFEKYRPKSIDDLVISAAKKDQIRQWFAEFREGISRQIAVLLVGPPGLGKTTLAHIILKEFNYHIKEFNASDIRSKALIEENISGLVNIPVNCFVARNGAEMPVNAIIMDEVDGMFKGDRGGVDALMSFITPKDKYGPGLKHNRKVPIICICNIGNVKKDTINNLRKDCFTLEFTTADSVSLTKVLERIVVSENMNLTEDTKQAIVEYAQGDFRRLVNILEFVDLLNGKKLITGHELDTCFDLMCRKDQDLYITDAVRELINKRLDPHKIQTIYNGDKSKTPMVIHQNYLRSISSLKTSAMNKINLSLVVVNSLITSDVIEKIMYNTQNWGLQPIQSFTCAHIPNYYMNMMSKTMYVEAKWASVLSINSQAQNLRKNIYAELQRMSNHKTYSIADLQQIIELVFIQIIHGKIATAVDMLHTYNLFNLDDESGVGTVTVRCVAPPKFSDISKKKALVIIDKLAKYIKISPYYEQWNIFKNAHKTDKELDTEIKDAILAKLNKDVSLTLTISKDRPATMNRFKSAAPPQTVLLDSLSASSAPSVSSSAPSSSSVSAPPASSSAPSASSAAAPSASSASAAAPEKSTPVIKLKVKTLEEQKSLVQVRKSVVIKKKSQ